MNITWPSPSLPANERPWQRCYARYGDLLLKLVEWHDSSSISERCEDTAASIDALTPTPTEPINIENEGHIEERTNPEQHLRQLWYYLDAIVKQLTPSSVGHDRLIAMLAELIKLGNGATFEAEGDKHVLWRDLPLLSMVIEQNWQVPDKDDFFFPIRYTEYINQNSFYARLFSHSSFIGLPEDLHTPLLTCGIAALRAALEEIAASDSSSESVTPALRKAHLVAAVQWIQHAGPQLFDEAFVPTDLRAGSAEFNEATAPGRMYLISAYSPSPGIHLPRWMFWRASFLLAAKKFDPGDGMTKQLKSAADRMECIEANNWLIKTDQSVMLAKSRVDAVNGLLIAPREKCSDGMDTENVADTVSRKRKRA